MTHTPRRTDHLAVGAEANGGISGLGLLECRDVVGSVRYAKSHKHLASTTTGLYSRCMGGTTIIAMAKWPDEFRHIRALVLLNVVSGKTFIERGAENLRLDPEKAAERLDERVRELTGFRLDLETPSPYAKHVKVPTLMAQLRRDFLIRAEEDGQAIFDALGAQKKELLRIENSNQRFYAYNHFGQHPERLIGRFDRYMGGSTDRQNFARTGSRNAEPRDSFGIPASAFAWSGWKWDGPWGSPQPGHPRAIRVPSSWVGTRSRKIFCAGSREAIELQTGVSQAAS
jgi:hypothetical protein